MTRPTEPRSPTTGAARAPRGRRRRGGLGLAGLGEEGVATVRDGSVVRADAVLSAMCGRTPAGLRGAPLSSLLSRVPDADDPWADVEVIRADGTTLRAAVTFRASARHGEGHVLVRPTGERDERAARDRHLATHDALTGLPNRTAFRERLDETLRRVRREECEAAVMTLDLDRFKAVNDTLGHPVGDLLLKGVAERLSAAVRDTDLVARFGGDEFAIVLSGTGSANAAQIIARRLIGSVSEPFVLDGHTVDVGVSVGIAVSPPDGTDADALTQASDLALYGAKRAGRGCHRFFTDDMNARMQERRALEADLRAGLRDGEFDLAYQPMVDVGTGRTAGFEAFLRWTSATRGPVRPNEFLGLAEEVGLMGEIGDLVIRRACRDAASWPGDVGVAVNLSAAQFKARDLAASVSSALAASGLKASRLEVEVTEDMLLSGVAGVLDALGRMKAMGVRIAVDDFGTGRSSIGHLRSLGFDAIKLNPDFVGREGAPLVRAVSALAHAFGARTVAEGIEDADRYAMMRDGGCAEAQGYFVSRPIAASAVAAHLEAERAGTVAAA